MTSTAEKRRRRKRNARITLTAWYLSILPALYLSVEAAREAMDAGEPKGAFLLVFVTVLSVWTGIESAHARLNADLD